MNGLRQLVDLLLATNANTLSVGLHDITCKEGHILGLQLQVAAKGIVHLLHLLGPVGITRIRLTLVHQDTLDYTILLCLLGQSNQSFVRVIAVCLQHSLHPARSLGLHVVGNLAGHKALDLDTTYSHVDHTDLDVLGQ